MKSQSPQGKPSAFNARTLAIGLVSLVLLAVWSHWHNVISVNRTPLNDNSPPIGGFGIFLAVFVVILLIELVNRRFRFPRRELIVVYTMLMVAAPWMGHGIWYRFIGLVYTIPRDGNQARLFYHYSDKLWPHGPQLIENGKFEADPPLSGYRLAVAPTKDEEAVEATLPDPKRAFVEDLEKDPQGIRRALVLKTVDDEMILLKFRIPRLRNGRAVIVPGENYLLSYLAKVEGAKGSTLLNCYLLTDRKDKTTINSLNRDTKLNFSTPSGFLPYTNARVIIPDRIDEYVDLVFEFRGAGTIRLADIRFYNNEAIQSLYQGRAEVRASDLSELPPNQRARVDVRPDRELSPRGILHRLRAAIPVDQWARPAMLWGSLIMAVFLALLALMVIMRKQWAENERFGFPMLIVPRCLLEQVTDENGFTFYPLFRKRVTWVGFGIAFFLILLQGLHHYFKVPSLHTQVDLAKFFQNNRPLYSFFRGFYWHPFNISLVVLPIAFFIELELLGSILLSFFICQLPYYLREDMFPSWKSIKDFPFVREQHTGAYMALALITLYAARRHLKEVLRKVFFGKKNSMDDREEAWSYRAMVVLLLACMVFFCWWMWYVDVGAWKGLLYFLFLMACGLSTARIRTECGTPWSYLTPYTPLIIFTALGGTYLFGIDMFVIMIVSGGFMCSASYLLCAPTQVEMLQLGNLFKVKARSIGKAAIFGALGGLLLGGYFLFAIAYGKGAMNVPYIGDWAANQSFQIRIVTREVAFQDQRRQHAEETGDKYGNYLDKPRLWALGISFVTTILLFVGKSMWVNFPLHPVGYILANTYFINMVWGSLLTAMLIKFIALKVGGVMTVRKTMTPFFVGVFLGAVSSFIFWDIIGLTLNAFGYMDTFCVPNVL
ncbi:MAG: hypothetical protein GXP31_03505 [Kiritimatiellaeota bacterium]|nr:hypothetical protein [Kiritimatiellota bacterium]